MEFLQRASALLRRTEAELRRILSDAATAGDYGSVVQVTAWARSLGDMLRATTPQARTTESGTAATRTSRKGQRVPRNQQSQMPRGNGYPRFFRQGDRLVRVSWSRRDKKEYEHKAPIAALEALTISIAEKGADGRVFAMDELLPIRDSEGVEVPAYQAYAGLGLLRQVGLIEQHGRQGYSSARPAELRSAVDAVVRNLPARQA